MSTRQIKLYHKNMIDYKDNLEKNLMKIVPYHKNLLTQKIMLTNIENLKKIIIILRRVLIH